MVLEGKACRNINEEEDKIAKRLKRLIENEWKYSVNSISHKTTEENDRNKIIQLPPTGMSPQYQE